MLAWDSATVSKFSDTRQGAEGFGDTTDKIQEKHEAFLQYKREEKPAKKTQMVTLGGLLSTLQASCRNNHRPIYEPAAEHSNDEIAQAWSALETQEETYEGELISNLILFRNLDASLKRFYVKAEKALSWLERTHSSVFDSTDYGVSATATQGLLENFELCMQQMELYEEYPDQLRDLVEVEGMDLHAEKGAALEKLAEIEEKIKSAKDAALVYQEKLELSSLEHEKAAELLKIQAWIDDRAVEYSPVANWEDVQAAAEEEAASNPDYVAPKVPAALKSTTRELELLIKQQEEKYTSVVDETEAKLVAIEGHPDAPQVEIDAKVAALTDKLNSLRDDADKFSKVLNARLEMLKGHLENIRTFNAGAAELTISIDELSEGLRAPLQVDSVLAAEKMVETFKADTVPMAESIQQKFSELEPAGTELLAVSEVEEEIRSAFTLYNLDDLRSAVESIAKSVAEREQDLVGEPDGLLVKEKAKEKLRMEFAMAATAFKKFTLNKTNRMNELEEEMAETPDLESMLDKFQEVEAAVKEQAEEVLDRLRPLQEKLDSQGDTNNPHTPETVDSLQAAVNMLLSRITADITSVRAKLDIEEKHKRMAAEYDERGAAFAGWCEQKLEEFQNREQGAAGFGDSVASIKATLNECLKCKVEDMPPQLEEMSAIIQLLADLHISQRAIHRPLHVPQDGCKPEDIQATWDGLTSAQVSYEKAIRDSAALFATIETELGVVQSKVARVKDWIEMQRAVFLSHDYGNSLAATVALEDNYALFLKQLELQKALPEKLNEKLSVDFYDLHELYDPTTEAVEGLVSDLEELVEQGKRYESGIKLSAEEYEKLALLIEPEQWAEGLEAVFDRGDLGTTIADVTTRLRQFDENYKQKLTGYLELVNSMSTLATIASQSPSHRGSVVSCLDKVNGVIMQLASLQSKAMAYETALLQRQEVLQELVESMNEFNTMAAEFDVMVDALDEELSSPLLADSMEDVDKAISTFDEETRAAMNDITEKYTAIDSIARGLIDSQEPLAQEAFARYDLATLYGRWQVIDNQTDEREMELKAEDNGYWAREQMKEQLRLEFAEKATELKQYIADKSEQVANLTGNLDDQVETMAALKAEYDASEAFAAIEPLSKQLEERGVLTNPHTPENLFTLTASWEALSKVYAAASASLQEQVMAEKGRQISPEQMAEIIEVFEFFDSDGSGSLNVQEFWSCCTGIGLVLSEEEVQETFNQLDTSGDGMISIDEFSVWMADRLTQPSHTQEDVGESFQVLNEWPVEYPARTEKKLTVNQARLETCFFDKEARDYVIEVMANDPACVAPPPPPVANAQEGNEEQDEAEEGGTAEEIDPAMIAATSGPEYVIEPFVTALFSR